jgi:hypothetical protein
MNKLSRAMVRLLLLVAALMLTGQSIPVTANEQVTFKPLRTQFIAALGDPSANSGSGAETWGLWRQDPGPRGVWLRNYGEQLEASGGIAPAGWSFDISDWWLDENGLIMEQPVFSMPAGKYIVTGDREAVAMLIVHPADANGKMRWQLGNGVKLHDVTHLPCRSARYTAATKGNSCSPAVARRDDFPVEPGGVMPVVEGCNKQDYSVLFIIAEAVSN